MPRLHATPEHELGKSFRLRFCPAQGLRTVYPALARRPDPTPSPFLPAGSEIEVIRNYATIGRTRPCGGNYAPSWMVCCPPRARQLLRFRGETLAAAELRAGCATLPEVPACAMKSIWWPAAACWCSWKSKPGGTKHSLPGGVQRLPQAPLSQPRRPLYAPPEIAGGFLGSMWWKRSARLWAAADHPHVPLESRYQGAWNGGCRSSTRSTFDRGDAVEHFFPTIVPAGGGMRLPEAGLLDRAADPGESLADGLGDHKPRKYPAFQEPECRHFRCWPQRSGLVVRSTGVHAAEKFMVTIRALAAQDAHQALRHDGLHGRSHQKVDAHAHQAGQCPGGMLVCSVLKTRWPVSEADGDFPLPERIYPPAITSVIPAW